MEKKKNDKHFFEHFASKVTLATGSTPAILLAFGSLVLWGLLDPLFHYSENWQLVINTGTTIITFLMVFLIQKAQDKESMAAQLKLNELVAAHEFASNRLVDVENMTEDELKVIQKYDTKLKVNTKKEESLQQSHSIDEADERHELKKDIEENVRKR
ncbi:MAG: low affinity iron permease family protein [Bacteroidota bacterium]|nr:low affinity iron permease family protein [Bacteroidota bacterium]